MPWGRVDDQHYRHEKVALLPEEHRKGALALFWLAISWCNDRLTDGLVPAGIVRTLGGDMEEADALVSVGLWERDGRNFRVHDYLDFNKSRRQIEEERAQRRLAGVAGAAARWHPASDLPSGAANDLPSDAASEMHGGSDAPVPRTPYTSNPDPLSRGLPHISDEVAAVLEEVTGRSILQAGVRQLSELDRLCEDHGAAVVIGAMRTVADGKTLTARQVVWPTMKYLEPIPATPKPPEEHRHRFYGYPVGRCECGLERDRTA